MKWGLVAGNIDVPSRQRTLGLARVVRHFNELAVPGIGNLWFGKPALLALLGLSVYEELGQGNIKIEESWAKKIRHVSRTRWAEAVEGWACLESLKRHGWRRDPRLRGRLKLRNLELEGVPFRRLLLEAGTYVSQPMRMNAVQALRELGFVEPGAGRFSAYRLSDLGREFIDSALRSSGRQTPSRWLGHWLLQKPKKTDAINLMTPLGKLPPPAAALLRECLVSGRKDDGRVDRRRRALDWVNQLHEDQLKKKKKLRPDWKIRPDVLSAEHWQDLHAGALFFQTRDQALRLLDELENRLAYLHSDTLDLDALPKSVLREADGLRKLAEQAEQELDRATASWSQASALNQALELAKQFYDECQESDLVQITNMVKRDGRVLVIDASQKQVRYGPLFSHAARPGKPYSSADQSVVDTGNDDDADAEAGGVIADLDCLRNLPGISERVANLYLLNVDLNPEWRIESIFAASNREYIPVEELQ